MATNNNCSSKTCDAEGTLPCPDELDISCIPTSTTAPPEWQPEPDQLPFAVYKDCDGSKKLYYHTCDHDWLYVDLSSLCDLEPLEINNINDLCELLQIPLRLDANGCCNTGTLTLNEFVDQFLKCLCAKENVFPDGVPVNIDPSEGGSFTFTDLENCVQRTVNFGAVAPTPVPTVSEDSNILVLTATPNDDGGINYHLTTTCPPTDGTITLATDGTATTEWAWFCNPDGSIVRKRLRVVVEEPEIPEICESLNTLDGDGDTQIPNGASVVFVDENGNCGKGAIKCCPAAFSSETAVGGAVCVAFTPTAADARGNIVYQARDNTFISGAVTPGVLGGAGILSINDTNPFTDSPAIARITVKGHASYRPLGPIDEDVERDLDQSVIYTLDADPNAPLPPYFDLNMNSSIVTLGNGWSSNLGYEDAPSGNGYQDLFEKSVSSAIMTEDVIVAAGANVQRYSQWWLALDTNNVNIASLPALFYHGEMTAQILWLRTE